MTGELVSLFKKSRPWRDDGCSGEEHDGIAGVPSLSADPAPPSSSGSHKTNDRSWSPISHWMEASFLPLQVFPKIPSPVHSPSILRTSLRLSLPPPLFLPPTSANGAGFPKSLMQTVLNILQIVLVESAVAKFLPLFERLGKGQKLENPLPRSTLRDKRERGKNLKPEPKLWDLLLLLLSQTSKTQNPPQPLPPSPLFSRAGISNTQNPNNHTKTWKDTLGKKNL